MTESSATPLLASVAGGWQLDPEGTTIEFHTKAMWGLANVAGTFGAVRGNGVVGDDGAVSGELVVDAASIDTKNKRRDTHLRSDDFLDVGKYPTLSFTASEAVPSGDCTLRVMGTLREVGALLEAKAFHPGRTARAHLSALAVSFLVTSSWQNYRAFRRHLRKAEGGCP